MKNKFSEFYTLSEKEVAEMWGECLFVVDTNVLLDQYRYTKQTRDNFLNLFSYIKNRLWLPHQVAMEFHKNRVDVIYKQASVYNDVEKIIEKTLISFKDDATKLLNFRNHPHINKKDLIERIEKLLISEVSEIKTKKESHEIDIYDDDILNKITELFSDNVGESYTDSELKEIYKKGAARYENEIGPGYMDAKGSSKKEGGNIYGDLVLWLQCLDKAKAENKPIILVTSDDKEDWWRKVSGRKIGPRVDLIKEMKDFANVNFYMYNPDKFMDYAKKYIDHSITEETITEIKDVRETKNRATDLIDRLKAYSPYISENTGAQLEGLSGYESLFPSSTQTALDRFNVARGLTGYESLFPSSTQTALDRFNVARDLTDYESLFPSSTQTALDRFNVARGLTGYETSLPSSTQEAIDRIYAETGSIGLNKYSETKKAPFHQKKASSSEDETNNEESDGSELKGSE